MIWPETHEVVVSRTMHPYALRIEIWPSGQDIEIGMKLEDFLAQVVKEMGSPAALLTKPRLLAALQEAGNTVTEKMRKDIIQAFTPRQQRNEERQ